MSTTTRTGWPWTTMVLAASLLAGAPGAETIPSAAAAPTDPPAGLSVLDLDTKTPPGRERPDPQAVHTIWRYWETWQSEAFKMDSGEIVRADAFRPVAVAKGPGGQPIKGPDGKAVMELRKAKNPQGSPLPADGWQQPDFNDSTWFRHEGPMAEGYRSLALVCVRGKFEVQDPARVAGLSLSLGFRGGVVAYVNGKEVGRAFLPEGTIGPETLAEPYPKEIYTAPNGALIDERSSGSADYYHYVITSAWAPQLGNSYGNPVKDPQTLANFLKRCRRMDLKIPASALRQGTNVLALEVHRAPANEIMYKAVASTKDAVQMLSGTWAVHIQFLGRVAPGIWWNHAMLEDIHLVAPTGTTGLTPNVARPKGMQVWNESIFKRILPTQYGDPNEPLRPVRLRGVRNGTCSGQIIVGSPEAIKGLKVTVTDLKTTGAGASGGGGTIPAAAVQVSYARWAAYGGYPGKWQFDALDPEAPGDLIPLTKAPWNNGWPMGGLAGVVQPVWLVVDVPRDAAVGTYAGTVTVTAAGQRTVTTPLEVRVVSNWVAPDPDKFTTYVGILESPDSVALQYNVPLWSEAHWKLLDRTMELLGQLGNREVYIPLITKTMLGNEQSMVRWIKQADGSYQHDFSIAERYLDLAVKHHWNVSVTCLALSDGNLGEALWYSGKPRNPPSVSVLDPATKQLSEMAAPAWGTPEAKAFWKPVVVGLQALLKKRGLEKSMVFGFVVQNQVLPQTVSDLKTLAPDVKWWEYTHWSKKLKGDPQDGQDVGRMSWAYGAPLAVFWDPAEDKPHYAWKNLAKDVYFVAAPRAKAQINVNEIGELSVYRLMSETTLLGSHGGEIIAEFRDFCGWGEVGADFWPVKIQPGDREAKRLDARYVGWGSLSLTDTLEALLGAGKTAPTHSCRTQMLRESQQEAEARVFVQNALLDDALKARLGPELAKQCQQTCDDRTRELFYCTVYFGENGDEYGRVFNQERWEEQTEKLYAAAGSVAKALGVK
jgi:hypothetical protein